MNILAALFLVILVCFQKSQPFCLPLNHHHQSSIINLLSCLFTIAHEYKMFQSYKCLVLRQTSSGKSMSDTEHDLFFSEMVNQDRNTVFTHTTLSHSVHTSQGHILPLSGVTCKDNATHKYTVVNFKLGKPIISLRIHLSFYFYSLTEKSCKESEYFEFEFQVVRIWCISFEFSKKNLNPNCRLTGH